MAKRGYLPQIFFLLLGGFLLYLSYTLVNQIPATSTQKFWGSISQDIAIIILTVDIMDFLWRILGGEPTTNAIKILEKTLQDLRTSILLLEDSRVTGLERAIPISAAYGTQNDWMNRYKKAQKSIDLLGFTLHVVTRGENFEEEIIRLVKNGVHVRILIMSEENKDLKALVNEEQIVASSLASTIEEIRNARKSFRSISDHLKKQAISGSYEFRILSNGVILLQLIRTDSELTIIQYLYSSVPSRNPLLAVRGSDSKLFEIYMREFENLWQLAESDEKEFLP